MEREFKQAVDRHFSFLKDEFRFKRGVEKDRDDLTVWYGDRRVRVSAILENAWFRPATHQAVRVMIGLLESGEEPGPYDPGLHRRQTSFDLEDLLPLYDDAWSTPERQIAADSPADAERVLAAYGAALRTHRRAALTGDPTVFERLADANRRRLINKAIETWSRFVERVCGGFDGSIGDYVDGINTRDQLQTFWQRWSGSPADDPVERLQELDDRFLACTEPLPFRFTKTWQVWSRCP